LNQREPHPEPWLLGLPDHRVSEFEGIRGGSFLSFRIAGSGGRQRGLNDDPAIDERFRLTV
jgi:hypothetical protein